MPLFVVYVVQYEVISRCFTHLFHPPVSPICFTHLFPPALFSRPRRRRDQVEHRRFADFRRGKRGCVVGTRGESGKHVSVLQCTAPYCTVLHHTAPCFNTLLSIPPLFIFFFGFFCYPFFCVTQVERRNFFELVFMLSTFEKRLGLQQSTRTAPNGGIEIQLGSQLKCILEFRVGNLQ